MKAPETTRKRLPGGGGSIRAWLDGKKVDKGRREPVVPGRGVASSVQGGGRGPREGGAGVGLRVLAGLAVRNGKELGPNQALEAQREEKEDRSGQGREVFSRSRRAG